jgi:hypothetical protein
MRIALLALFVAAPAFAQRGAPAPRHIDVEEDEDVTGTMARPDERFIQVRLGARHRSMIPVRAHFLDEMLRSAERL